MKWLDKGQLPILIVNAASLAFFAMYYIAKGNYEFKMYIVALSLLLVFLIYTNRKVHYTKGLLWGLTAWAQLHLGGGCLYIGGTRLYDLMLIPITENVFRYDQFVHMFGFGVTTCLLFHVLKPLLRPQLPGWWALSFVIILAGLGAGALNEIVEFGAVVFSPEKTGVGGYENNSLDLVADFLGAIIAMIYLRWRNGKLYM